MPVDVQNLYNIILVIVKSVQLSLIIILPFLWEKYISIFAVATIFLLTKN